MEVTSISTPRGSPCSQAVERSSGQGAQRFEESLSWPPLPCACGSASAKRFDSAAANAEYSFLCAEDRVIAGVVVNKQHVLVADVQRTEVVEFVNVDEVAAIDSSATLPNVHDRAWYRRMFVPLERLQNLDLIHGGHPLGIWPFDRVLLCDSDMEHEMRNPRQSPDAARI